ncbi:MAG: response regulator [Sulfurimonas sp.]|nr:response regulator [Sulfurimonas sp.]
MKKKLLITAFALPLFAATSGASEQETLIIYIFALAIIGIFALFLSSHQMRKLKIEHKKMRQQQESMEKNQQDLLLKMSNNILSITKEAIGNTNNLVDLDEKDVRSKLSQVINTENTLLDVTGDLIEFLKLKSKKVKITKNNFKLENLLNDILGQTRTNYKNSNIDLIFDVDDNIPDTLFSDTLSISKILVNLLDFCILNKSKQIVLQVSKRSRFNAESTLHFILYTDMKIEINNDIFNTKYNEKTKKYDGISLFVSKELSILLDGILIARNAKDSTAEFVLTLPYFPIKKEILSRNNLDINALCGKKVFVVDSFFQSTLSIQKILQSLKFQVDIRTKDEYLKELPDFSNYDTIILDERLITDQAIQEINSVKKTINLKIIILTNVFSEEKKIKLDGLKLNKPLTKESIYYTLLNAHKKTDSKEITSKQTLKIQTERFKDTPNISLSDFIDFAGANLLIVEDNLINQKVLVSMLKKSKINITIANNGQEALNILFSQEQFDLVLMDINMPVMDGYLATQRIRENSGLNHTPIVALSALTATDEINKIFHSGMNGYLSKPFYKEKLYTAFDTFMVNKKTAHAKKEKEIIKIVNHDGLNVFKGLEQTNGNVIFYIEILKEFLEGYGQSDSIFEKLIKDHRFEQTKMLCLDIRGLSGSIGAYELQELSSEIIQKIVFKKFDSLPSLIQRYTQIVSTLKHSINKFIDSQT